VSQMILENISPYIRLAMDNTIQEPWHLQERVLFDYELLYLMEGEVLVTIEDQVYEGKAGDIFLFRPKQRHAIKQISKFIRQPHIHFDFFYNEDSHKVKVSFKPLEKISEGERAWFREDIIDQMPIHIPSHLRLKNPKIIENMMLELIHEFEGKIPFYEIKVKGLFIELWIQILRENYWNLHPHLVTNLQALLQVKHYLNNAVNRKVTLAELSKMSGISKHYLVRLFKKAFGMSPLQYHQFKRIQMAKLMIQCSDLSLVYIAEQLGYPNIHAFSRAFKITDGINPSYYKSGTTSS
jgi:AraC-like DNA-binding protein